MGKRAKRKIDDRPSLLAANRSPAAALPAERWVAWGAIGLVLFVLLDQCWGRCPDLIVDFGREVYVPWRLTLDETLYTEIAYFNGPLSPYLNSVWFRLGGASIACLAVANATILVLCLWLTCGLLEQIGSRRAAFLATLTFVLIFACGHYSGIGNYNFIYPYSHEMTHGLTLSIAALFGFCCFMHGERWPPLVVSGLCLGLAFLTKPEIFLALACALVCGLALWSSFVGVAAWRGRAWLVLGASALVPPLVAFLLLWRTMPLDAAARATLGGFVYLFNEALVSQSYFGKFMGTDDTGQSLRAILKWLGIYALVFVPIGWVALRVRLPRPWQLVANVGVGLATAIVCWRFREPLIGEALFPLPLAMLGAGAWSAWHLWTRRGDPAAVRQAIAQLMLAGFALLLLLKIVFRAQITHYGFVLALPATLVLVVAMLNWIPRAIRDRGGRGELFQAAWIGAWVAFVMTCWLVTRGVLDAKIVKVGTGGDTIAGFPKTARGVEQALKQIATNVGPDQTLLVVPEGVMINYLARRKTPTPYINFVPTELSTHGEDRMLAAFEAHPPDFVAWVPRSMHDYGLRGFNIDYGMKLGAWIRAHYETLVAPRNAGEIELLGRARGDKPQD